MQEQEPSQINTLDEERNARCEACGKTLASTALDLSAPLHGDTWHTKAPSETREDLNLGAGEGSGSFVSDKSRTTPKTKQQPGLARRPQAIREDVIYPGGSSSRKALAKAAAGKRIVEPKALIAAARRARAARKQGRVSDELRHDLQSAVEARD